MYRMIALGGVVVRNSPVLIEFIDQSLAEGKALREAILESGGLRRADNLLMPCATNVAQGILTNFASVS